MRRQAFDRPLRPAPAGDVEADALQFPRSVKTQHAKPEHADAHVARRRLHRVIRPELCRLLAVVTPELPVMQQRVQQDPFAHAIAQVRIDDANERDIGQLRIAQ